MLDTIFLIVVGVVVGWMIPQPSWAKPLTDKISSIINKK